MWHATLVFRLRVAALLTAGVLLAAGPARPGESASPPRNVKPLRFITFNLLHGGPFSGLNGNTQALHDRLRMVVEELQALQPDVIGLQEASAGRWRGSVASRLAGDLGFVHAYAPANPRPLDIEWINRGLAFLLGFSEGPAIASRFPIVASSVHHLPRCGERFESRVLLTATLQTPWGEVQAHSTHTGRNGCQLPRVRDLVLQERRSLPSVLMGDLNAVEGSAALASLTDGGGLVDAFRAANPTLPGATAWQRIAAPDPTVHRRVDYIFVLPGDRVAGRVLASRVVLNRPGRSGGGDVLWPSDHYGVLADVEIFPGGPPAAPPRARQRGY
jgi:endonuclease/exonuclease/phosphatase family metal-dependent hydrolase